MQYFSTTVARTRSGLLFSLVFMLANRYLYMYPRNCLGNFFHFVEFDPFWVSSVDDERNKKKLLRRENVVGCCFVVSLTPL